MTSQSNDGVELFIDADGIVREGRLVKRFPVESIHPSTPTFPNKADKGKTGGNSILRALSRTFTSSSVKHSSSEKPKVSKLLKFLSGKQTRKEEVGAPWAPENVRMHSGVKSKAQRSGWRSNLYRERTNNNEWRPDPKDSEDGKTQFLFDSNGVPLFKFSGVPKKETSILPFSSVKSSPKSPFTPPPVAFSRKSGSWVGNLLSSPSPSVPGTPKASTPHRQAKPLLGQPKSQAVINQQGDSGLKKKPKKRRDTRKSFSDGYISFGEEEKKKESKLLPEVSYNDNIQELFHEECQRLASSDAAEEFSLPVPPTLISREFASGSKSQEAVMVPDVPDRNLNAPFRLPTATLASLKTSGVTSTKSKHGKQGPGSLKSRKGRTHRASMSDGDLSPSEASIIQQRLAFWDSQKPSLPRSKSNAIPKQRLEVRIPHSPVGDDKRFASKSSRFLSINETGLGCDSDEESLPDVNGHNSKPDLLPSYYSVSSAAESTSSIPPYPVRSSGRTRRKLIKDGRRKSMSQRKSGFESESSSSDDSDTTPAAEARTPKLSKMCSDVSHGSRAKAPKSLEGLRFLEHSTSFQVGRTDSSVPHMGHRRMANNQSGKQIRSNRRSMEKSQIKLRNGSKVTEGSVGGTYLDKNVTVDASAAQEPKQEEFADKKEKRKQLLRELKKWEWKPQDEDEVRVGEYQISEKRLSESF